MTHLPNLPFRRRHGDPADAQQLDELLGAGRLDATPTPEWQSVSDILRSAAAISGSATESTTSSDLAGEAAILAAFRREHEGNRRRRFQPIARYRTMLSTSPFSTLLTGKIAVGLAAGVVTLTGAATAAYACVLPTPLQSIAHSTIGAPSPSGTSVSAADFSSHHHHGGDPFSSPPASPSPSVTATATSTATSTASATTTPSVTPSAAVLGEEFVSYRLCADYSGATTAGKTLDAKELAVLTKLASSSTSISAYCAALPALPTSCPTAAPTATPSVTPSPSTSGVPTLRPLHWGPWCGMCPQLRPYPTASPSVSPTPTTTAVPGIAAWRYWCGFRDPRHHGDPFGGNSFGGGKPTATTSPTAHPTFSFEPGNPGSFGDGGSHGFGSSQGHH